MVTFASPSLDCVAAVVDTESRHLPPDQAFARVRAAVESERWDLVYKKTDSTLRGNLAAELDALGGEVLFIPAYPAMGRTVVRGELYVEGALLHTTAFAHDPLNPMTSSAVSDTLRGCSAKVHVHDAQTEEQIAELVAQALQRHTILAGPANLAGHLARLIDAPRSPIARARPLGQVLVVNGSLHPASASQFEFGRARNWPDWAFASGWQQLAHDTLIVFGGDTAFEIVQLLGITEIEPMHEVLPGVPIARAGNLQLITKAGGFGQIDLLKRVRAEMSQAL